MPASLVFSIIFGVIAVILFLVWHGTRKTPTTRLTRNRRIIGWASVSTAVLAVVFLLASSINVVGTKEEGVETSFGKTAGQLGNGPHVTWPWIKVHEMDAAIQTDTFSDSSTDSNCDAIAVRIANQQTGCANVSIQWRIHPPAVDDLYKNYRSFDHVRDALVTRKLSTALNLALANFNPLKGIDAAHPAPSPLPGYAADAKAIMQKDVGSQIEVLNVLLPIITFDPETQSRINQLQQQVALTQIADQQKKTNAAQAAANKALATSSLSELVLVSKCMDGFETMVKNNDPIPAGFSCWPGGSLAGVIAGSSK